MIEVFLDVEDILPGDDFESEISERLASIAVVFALIGPSWLTVSSPDGRRRLDDPRDFVRAELSVALKQGVRVVPVLIDGAKMPSEAELPDPLKPLASRNAFPLRHERFNSDMTELEHLVARTQPARQPNPSAAVPPAVVQALNSAFGQFIAAANPRLFLIAENDEGQFVQFADVSEGSVEVDLPTQPLRPRQFLAAQRLLLESYRASTQDQEASEHFSFKLRVPATAAYLTLITLEIFEQIYGAPPQSSLSIRIDAF